MRKRGFIGVPLRGRGFIGVPLRLSSYWALGFALQAPTPNQCLFSLRTCGIQCCFQARCQPALCSPRGHVKLGKKRPPLPENNLQPLPHARPLPYKPSPYRRSLDCANPLYHTVTGGTRITTPWREGGEEEAALACRGTS